MRFFTRNAFLLFCILFFSHLVSNAQIAADKIEPPHWWVNMENDTLHLIIYGSELKNIEVSLDKKDVEILDTREVSTSNYLFLDLLLNKDTKPEKFVITLKNKKNKTNIEYEFKPRDKSKHQSMGLDQSDLIYLIMPDRFANGDESNDVISGTNQEYINRDTSLFRHGGDLQGIINHTDYFNELGVTALWLNPAEENDQPLESYHGYAITDFYSIDPRLGNNELYKSMVNQLHKKEIKIIRDVVFNHFGSEHPLIKNLPDTGWINHWDDYTRSNFRATALLDPYASDYDKKQFSNGWFDHHMPDMNYNNKDLQDYMIQNSIWWIEEMDIDAYRIDTYAYPNQDFMKRWAKAVKTEYPEFFMFAETWVHGSAIQAWFAGGNKLNQGENYLDGVTDFQMYYAINNTLNNSYGWTQGVAEIYYVLAQDFLYQYPEQNVTFIDNHDLDRFYGTINQDFEKFKMGVAILMTVRGIPSLFYGTELLMPYKGDHGLLRSDFPGGWKEDKVNKFNSSGRSDLENEAFDYIKKLAHWRKNSEAITKGKTIQYIPEDGVFVYFRYTDNEAVMVALNQNNKSVTIDLSQFEEILKGKNNFIDITNDQKQNSIKDLTLKGKYVHVFEVK
jgi:glycosidase